MRRRSTCQPPPRALATPRCPAAEPVQLRLLVLGNIQRALGFQHRQQRFGAGAVALLCQGEGGACFLYLLVLPLPLAVYAMDRIQRFSTSAKPARIAAR